MKKLIKIDNKDIILSTNGATPLFYKKDFGRDFFSDMTEIVKGEYDLYILFYLFYEFAAAGEKEILPFEDYFKQFERFAIGDYVNDLIEIATECIRTTQSIKKNGEMTENR